MSQSDYIKFKRISTKLAVDNKLVYNKQPPVFAVGDYIDFKQYYLENTVMNTSPTYNYIVPTGHQIIFNMDKVVSSCPTFICSNTNRRPNRVPMSASYFTPTPSVLNWKKKNLADNQRFINCGCNRKVVI